VTFSFQHDDQCAHRRPVGLNLTTVHQLLTETSCTPSSTLYSATAQIETSTATTKFSLHFKRQTRGAPGCHHTMSGPAGGVKAILTYVQP
jgi:hypothetical protein